MRPDETTETVFLTKFCHRYVQARRAQILTELERLRGYYRVYSALQPTVEMWTAFMAREAAARRAVDSLDKMLIGGAIVRHVRGQEAGCEL